MAVDRPSRGDDPDEQVKQGRLDQPASGSADQVNEAQAKGDTSRQNVREWRDPRDVLSAEDRALSYNRRHEPLTEEEIDALEAENLALYDWDHWDELTGAEELEDQDKTGGRDLPAEGRSTEAETGETGEATGDDAGLAPAKRVDLPERADQPCPVSGLRIGVDYFPPGTQGAADDSYFVRDKAKPVPRLDGPPTREQTAQGRIGDCGVVATLGAVAAHRPDAISNAVTPTGYDTYEVRMHKVDPSTPRDPVARPIGDTVTYMMDGKIPVLSNEPGRPPAGVKADTCAWPALMEKAIAAEDQAWDRKQQADWDQCWLALKPYVDAERRAYGLGPSPRAAPTGYDRLDIGTTPYQRADLLAEITGEEAEVRTMPNEQQGEQALLDEFRDRLADGKPILVGTRADLRGEIGPYQGQGVFAFGHAYEVTKVENDKIHLRNPWNVNRFGRSTDPPPMDVQTFWEYYRQYNPDGSRTGYYSTLR